MTSDDESPDGWQHESPRTEQAPQRTPGRDLRYAVMVPQRGLARWQVDVLDMLFEDGVAEPVLRITQASEVPTQASRNPDRLWRAYNRSLAFRARATAPALLPDYLADVPVLTCSTKLHGRWSEYFADADVDAIRDAAPDFVLRFAFGIIRGRILDVAPHGVWSFHHGDERQYRGGPPCFWEVVDGAPTTGAILQRLHERLDDGQVLKRGTFRTVHHSYRRSKEQVYLGSTAWPAQVAREIASGQLAVLDHIPERSSAAIRRNPDDAQMLRFAAGWPARMARNLMQGVLVADDWRVSVIARHAGPFIAKDVHPSHADAPIKGRRRGDYVADPFLVPGGRGDEVLVETYSAGQRLGRIARVHRSIDGWSAPQCLDLGLAPDEHISYPFCFEHDGRVWMVPETSSRREVRLYVCTGNSASWSLRSVLLRGPALLDPTLVQHEGLWWLFATDADAGPLSHLVIWHAPDLFGPWSPHVANPVKVDVAAARPAGRFYRDGGHLMRVAQDCSTAYGGAVTVLRVDRLTTTTYAETKVDSCRAGDPTRGFGLHTLDVGDEFVALDSNRRRFAWRVAIHELVARLLSAAR